MNGVCDSYGYNKYREVGGYIVQFKAQHELNTKDRHVSEHDDQNGYNRSWEFSKDDNQE